MMFPLCSACADTMNQGNCILTDEESCISGTWVMDEIRKDIQMGLILVNVFQFGEYEITCLDRNNNSGGHFVEYVNMFLKLKQEVSGYPSWVQGEADKDKYIEDYRRVKGIALGKASISKNAEQRTLAKLNSNSMWGKWAQNQNKNQTTLVTSVNVLYELRKCAGTEVTNLIFPNLERGMRNLGTSGR